MKKVKSTRGSDGSLILHLVIEEVKDIEELTQTIIKAVFLEGIAGVDATVGLDMLDYEKEVLHELYNIYSLWNKTHGKPKLFFYHSSSNEFEIEHFEESLLWDHRYNRPRILIDMDDCINNFMSHLCKVYNERTGENVKPSQIKDWDISKYMQPIAFDIFREEGFFEDVAVKKKSTSTLKRLIESKLYDVYIITACKSANELEQKVRWMQKLLPSFNPERIIKCYEKEIVRGDVLIDDKLDNLHACSPYMRCLVFDMPHNRQCNKYPRIKSLEEAVPYFEEWFYPNANK